MVLRKLKIIEADSNEISIDKIRNIIDKMLIEEKFKKLSSKPTGGENSTGLGLSIVKQLVEKLQGEITCKSTHGNVTTFIVDLPLIS